jgi:hypothetical protein
MNTQKLARGWALIAEGAMELSLAYESIDQPGSAAVPPVTAAPADDLPPLPPLEEPPNLYEPKGNVNLADQHVANVLGQCPTHQRNWVVKEGGVSKAGKPYSAFWKCPEKDPNDRSGYCSKRPVKAWTDANPIGAAA